MKYYLFLIIINFLIQLNNKNKNIKFDDLCEFRVNAWGIYLHIDIYGEITVNIP